MRTLGQPNPAFADDHGEPDPQVRAALMAAQQDDDAYLDAVVALCTARLLLPIVASGDEAGDGPDPDRHAEMAAVLVENPAGERALLAFTGVDALQAWNPTARPVPCTLDDLAATVVETGAAVLLLDGAGPTPFVLGGDLIDALGRGQRLVRLPDGGFGWMYRTDGPVVPD